MVVQIHTESCANTLQRVKEPVRETHTLVCAKTVESYLEVSAQTCGTREASHAYYNISKNFPAISIITSSAPAAFSGRTQTRGISSYFGGDGFDSAALLRLLAVNSAVLVTVFNFLSAYDTYVYTENCSYDSKCYLLLVSTVNY
jgi:hypothetical protein